MSDVIRLLPDSVANQIAAGEVIQRPASVVKELVENAVDAGADIIKVIIKDAGRTLIQVVDNGAGMSATDARMAFERHATSKIAVANDLFSLHTMGFRGEALASIAAVAQVDMRTMRKDDSVGTHLLISGSKVESQQPDATAPGTNMMVKNLFFNVPARRKFLKKDSVEMSNILHEFERLALVNPDRELTIIRDDETVHQLLKGSLKQRIGQLFGKSLEKHLIPIATETSLVKISGFVGLPESVRRRGALQYFFVNGRNMRHPYFHKAVMHCYEQLIRPDEQPNYFINFEVDPSTIDVNIHPTKNEIKFENEQPIWQILTAAIRESLGRFNAVPSIDFDSVDMPEIPAFKPDGGGLGNIGPMGDYNPFAETAARSSNGGGASATWRRDTKGAVDDWEKLYRQFQSDADANPMPDFGSKEIPSRSNVQSVSLPIESGEGEAVSDVVPSMMQLKNRYIVTRNKSGLLLIDQHRAHVRVLYEQYATSTEERMPSQQVMFPEIVNLSPDRHILLREVLDEVLGLGFDLQFIGHNSWSINGIPVAEISGGHSELLKSILDDIAQGTDVTREGIRRVTALNLARAAAIPSGRQLTSTEMEHLVSRLFSLPTPSYTPDGLKVIAELPIEDVEKMF